MVYSPSYENFCKAVKPDTLMPVFEELPADLETPVSVYLKLGLKAPAFLLESVERGEQLGRYSVIGSRPSMTFWASGHEAVLSHEGVVERFPLKPLHEGGPDALKVLESLLKGYRVAATPGLPRFFGGAVGYIAYDMVRFFEKLPDCPRDELNLPDCVFLFTDTLVIFDHVQQRMKVVSNVRVKSSEHDAYQEAVDKIEDIKSRLARPLKPDASVIGQRAEEAAGKPRPKLISNFTRPQFTAAVRKAKEYIMAGDAFQIVPSQRLHRETDARPFDIYRSLRMLNPSPYMFYLDFGGFQLIGSSPEMLVKLEGDMAETRPIAGTKPRGATEEEDNSFIAELLSDPKERAEHVMLVDLGRNDVGRVCEFKTVHVPVYMSAEKYSHVIHIVSSVKGKLKAEYNAFDLLRACFPAGTLTGAPKIRAMEIINELEGLRRGPYGGAVGYFGFGGSMDTCITIRTIVMKDGQVYLQGGAGIVADSDPESEYDETLRKIAALEKAVNLAEGREG